MSAANIIMFCYGYIKGRSDIGLTTEEYWRVRGKGRDREREGEPEREREQGKILYLASPCVFEHCITEYVSIAQQGSLLADSSVWWPR